MALYGSGNENTVITEYLDSHLEEGITQKNLDFILDLIDEYCELAEARSNETLDQIKVSLTWPPHLRTKKLLS